MSIYMFKTTCYTTKRLGTFKVAIYRSIAPTSLRGVRFQYSIRVCLGHTFVFEPVLFTIVLQIFTHPT